MSDYCIKEHMKLLEAYVKAVRKAPSAVARWTPEGIMWFDGRFEPHADDDSASPAQE